MAQSFETKIQTLAATEVEQTYPDVYRGEGELRNHAYAVAQDQVQSNPEQASGSVQDYAEAYIAAYRKAVEERDAQQ